MLHTLAHCVDARIEGLQGVVDHDAPLAVQPGGFGQLHVGTDAHRHHHQVGRDLAAVLEAHAGHAPLAEDRLGLGLHQKLQAALLQRGLEQVGGRLVELALHQDVHEVDHGHVHAVLLQAVGRFQAEQAAADHHRLLVVAGALQHDLHVADVAEADHPFQVVSRHRDDEGVGAGGKQQPVVLRHHAGSGPDLAGLAVDRHHRVARMQGDALLGVPLAAVEHDVVHRLLAGQYRRQHDAVVVGMGLGAEHGDLVHPRLQLQQLLEGAYAGHAVADQDQFLFVHWLASSVRRACSGAAGSGFASRNAFRVKERLFTGCCTR